MSQDWETIEFSFHQWRADSGAVEFIYTTDTGEIGTVWYILAEEESTWIASSSYASTQIAG